MNRSPGLIVATAVFALLVSSSAAQNLLLVRTSPSSYNSEEQARVTLFEGWGYTVTPIHDGASQGTFDAAVASADIAYVPATINDYQLLYKLRTASCGVVVETIDLDAEFGFADGDAYTQTDNDMGNTVNTHDVTSGLSTGTVTFLSSNQAVAVNNNTLAPGLQKLSERNFGGMCLGVMDDGATLANSYSGNSTASGKRVRLPWGGFGFPISSLNSNGTSILQNALSWASGGEPLVGHWKLDELSGTQAVDSSAYGHDGEYEQGPVLGEAGKRGAAVRFDGSNDRVALPSIVVSSSAMTLNAWVRADSFPGSASRIIAKASGSGQDGNYWTLTTYNSGGNAYLGWLLKAGSSSTSLIADADDPLPTGQWVMVTAVYDGAQVRLYRDAELIHSAALSGSIHAGAGVPVRVGGSPTNGEYFDGLIDEVRVYREALTHEQIVELYGLLGHWRLDEGSGTTLEDESPNKNHAAFSLGIPEWRDGVRGGALEFNGGNTAATGLPFDPPPNGTVAFWYRFNDEPTGWQKLFGTGTNWEVRCSSAGVLYADIGGTSSGFETHNGATLAGRWRHLVAVYSSDDNDYKMYLDGALVASGSMGMADQPAAALAFGTSTGFTYHFDGALDDFRVYNYELSEAEVAELYGLIGHWKLDEASGTVASDSSLAGLDGAHSGGVTVGAAGPYSGEGDTAAQFDGSNDHVALPAINADFNDGCTIAVWAHPTEAKPWARFLGIGNGEYADNILFARRVATNDLILEVKDGSSGDGAITAPNLIDQDEWHHYVGVIYSDGSAAIYKDGQLAVSGTTGVPNSNDRVNCNIARSNWASDAYYEGHMHDMRLYNRPLSHAEIAEVYGLVGHWNLDESSGSTAWDNSGMEQHGTYAGTVTLNELGPKPNATAAHFDGVDGHVQLPVYDLDFTKGYSITAWGRPTASKNWGRFLELGSGQSTNNFFLSRYYSSDALTTRIHNGSLGGAQGPYSSGAMVNNAWHHYACTVDSSGNATLYVDQSEVGTGTIGVPADQTRVTNYIARGSWSTIDYYEGKMFDVRLYNRPLTTVELEDAYKSGVSSGVRIIRWVESR